MCGSTSNELTTCVPLKPEQRIADIISRESGAYIHPQVLRLIIKYNWRELSKAAHEIHGDA